MIPAAPMARSSQQGSRHRHKDYSKINCRISPVHAGTAGYRPAADFKRSTMLAKVRETEIYFDVDGMGLVPREGQMVQRPTLFLLHGGPGGDHSSFKTQVADLRDTAQLVYVDHRGSGRSAPGDPQTHTLDNNIDDLDALREHLGLERISLLGSSYGGMVAQGYAIRYPDRLANLILVATAPSFRFLEDAKRIVNERGTADQIRVCQRLWDGNFESLEQLHELKHFWRRCGAS